MKSSKTIITALRHRALRRVREVVSQRGADRPRSRRRQRGMTLVEIMVVVVIMSLVAGVVGVAVFNALAKAQSDTALTQIRQIADALDIYKLQHRKYPSTGEGLKALTESQSGAKPVMNTLPKDPWGNEYVYIYPGQRNSGSFDLMSYGEDGVAGGDDIANWSEADGTK